MAGLIRLFALIGATFGSLAALMAFLITWNELQKHKLPARRLAAESMRTAVFTFVLFFVLALVIGYVFTTFIAPGS